jgi:FMN phosphatase YigB (HAD superfamily)
MIGNNCQKDIIGAKKAGWNTIWFNENEAQTTECKEADMSLFFMGALEELIQKIDNYE